MVSDIDVLAGDVEVTDEKSVAAEVVDLSDVTSDDEDNVAVVMDVSEDAEDIVDIAVKFRKQT